MALRSSRHGLAAAVLVSLAGMAGCVSLPPLNTGVQASSAAATSVGVLDIQTANGAVTVSPATDGQVSAQATIRAAGEERLALTRLVVEPKADGSVRVFVEWPEGGRRGNEGASLVVQAPATLGGLNVRTSNGPVKVEGMNGPAMLDTSNGAVTVLDHTGSVNADTSNGRVELRRIAGDVVLDTSNGRIEAEDVSGSVRADTSNGSMTVRLSPTAMGPLDLSTSNGSVHLDVGPSFAGVIDASTSNGSVSVKGATGLEGSTKRCTARFGSNEIRSVIRTSNGSVSVARTEQ